MAIREFIEAVYVHGEMDGKPKWVEVKGRLARLFDQSAQAQSLLKEARGDPSWGKVVAEEGFEPPTQGL